MGLIDSINRSFRPVNLQHRELEVTPGVAPPQGQDTIQQQKPNGEKDLIEGAADVDDLDIIEKPIHRDVESGVARVEAIQAVWGKYGLWLIGAG